MRRALGVNARDGGPALSVDCAPMRTLSLWLLVVLSAVLVITLAALVLALEAAPRVTVRDDVSPADVDRAVALVRMHDPRRARTGQLRWLTLRERDLDLLVHQAARRWLGAATRVRLQGGGRLVVQASVAAPLGRWLNIELALRQGAVLPEPDSLHVGRLPLPAALVLPLLRTVAARQGVQADALLAVEWIERVTIAPRLLIVSYRIGPDTANQLRAALVAPAEQQRLRAYTERLAALAAQARGDELPLVQLLQPMLALAAERGRTEGDAVAEHRAALLTLTFFANHRPLRQMVPAAAGWPRPRPLVLTLQQRHDLALHFLVSAVIAAEAGTPLADAVGLWKELADARRGGSGFSFNDLAADRAGTRLGELAVNDPARLHSRIGPGTPESAFMPETRDLPEFLPEAEFIARYGGIGGAGYLRLLADIEARIDALPLFR